MKKSTLLAGGALLIAGAIYAGSSVSALTAPTPEPRQEAATLAEADGISVALNPAQGTHQAGKVSSANFSGAWVSATTPQIVITVRSQDNNIDKRATDHFQMHGGSNGDKSCDYDLTAEGTTRPVVGFSFRVKKTGSAATITAGDKSIECTDEYQTFEATGTSFHLADGNGGVNIVDFVVKLGEGEDEKAKAPFETTTVSGGQFAANTVWYLLTNGAAGYVLADNGDEEYIALNNVKADVNDHTLWAVAGDAEEGYTIYNKAAGTGKMLAAPKEMMGTTGGESYAILLEPGDDDYCYKWDFNPSTNIAGSFYISQHGEPSKALNNRGGKLAFWSTGKDSGSSFVLSVTERTFVMDLLNGKMSARSDGNATNVWRPGWESNMTGPGLTFSCGKNNMTADGTNVGIASGGSGTTFTWAVTGGGANLNVTHVEFDASTASSATNIQIGFAGKTYDIGRTPVHIEADIEDGVATISLTGANDVVTITNCTVKVELKAPVYPGVEVMTCTGSEIPYRIPAIATVGEGEHKGRLIAVADYRYSRADIGGSGKLDLRMSYSDDNGETWSTPEPLKDEDGNPVSMGAGNMDWDHAFGDPCIVADRESQRILIMSCAGTSGFWGGRRDKPQYCASWWSEDGGETWTPAHNSTEAVYSLFDGTSRFGFIDSMFIGSGRIFQSRTVKKGDTYRIYCSLSSNNYAANNGHPDNYVIYSDDFGQTWNVLGDPSIPAVKDAGDEPKVEELPDGSILFAGRGHSGGRNYNIFTFEGRSTEKGTWSTFVNSNLNNPNGINACNGEIMIVPVKNNASGEEAYIAIQTYPFGPGRVNVGLSWKILEGEDIQDPASFAANWDGRYQLSKLSSCYTTMTLMDNGHIGFLYEDDRYKCSGGYCIVFRDLSIDDITDGAWTFTTDPDFAIADKIANEINIAKVSRYLELEPRNCVGMLTADAIKTIQAAARTYLAAPSREAMAAFNEVLDAQTDYIAVVEDVKYRISNCGRTPSTPKYLTIGKDGKLASTTSASSACDWEFVKLASRAEGEAEQVYIRHAATGKYIGQTPVQYMKVPVVETVDDAHLYTYEHDTDGFTVLKCVNPVQHPALHLDSHGVVVSWHAVKGTDDNGSFWYLVPDDPQKATVSGIDGVHYDGIDLPARFYDLQGRPVEHPVSGRVYITSDRRKVLVM